MEANSFYHNNENLWQSDVRDKRAATETAGAEIKERKKLEKLKESLMEGKWLTSCRSED